MHQPKPVSYFYKEFVLWVVVLLLLLCYFKYHSTCVLHVWLFWVPGPIHLAEGSLTICVACCIYLVIFLDVYEFYELEDFGCWAKINTKNSY